MRDIAMLICIVSYDAYLGFSAVIIWMISAYKNDNSETEVVKFCSNSVIVIESIECAPECAPEGAVNSVQIKNY